MLHLPSELVTLISEFLIHPEDFFSLKSSCYLYHSLLPDTFRFANVDQLVVASRQISDTKIPFFEKIQFASRITIESIIELTQQGVNGSLIASMASHMSSLDVQKMAVSYPRLSLVIFVRASFINSLNLAFSLLEHINYYNVVYGLDLTTRCVVIDRIADYGNDSQVSMLFRHYPNVFTPALGKLILNKVIRRSLSQSVTLLWSIGVDFSTSVGGIYPIQAAVESGNSDIVELLLNLKVCVNVRYRHGKSDPLHSAVAMGSFKIAGLLLMNGAKRDVKDFYGRTPLCIISKKIREIEKNMLRHNETLNGLFRLRDLLVT